MKKRFLSLLLCIMLLVSLLPTSAFATDPIQAYYFIGTMSNVYTKVYDGTKLQADVLTYDGYLNTDSITPQITNGNITHVNQYGTMAYDGTLGKNIGSLELHYDAGYPKVFRNEVDVTSEYTQTQVTDYDFSTKTPGCMTFTIISRDITLQSANLTKEYDGTALTAYSQQGGTNVSDLTAGLTDKGYVSGEEFDYTFTGSQLFVGSSDNSFTVGSNDTTQTTDYNVTQQYGTLTVTGRTVPLTITIYDQEKTYDGTATIDTSSDVYSVAGDLATGDTITVTVSSINISAGTYTDGITASYKIMHNNGDGTYTDVTNMYLNVTVDTGDLTINKRDVTLTSASDEKPYNGTPLTNSNVSGSGFVGTDGAIYNVTGSQTALGSSPNYFTFSAADGTNLNNYNVTKVEGTLTVTQNDSLVTITADSNSKIYDGKELTDSGYTVTGLTAGHTATVTVAGTITNFGTAANTVTGYTIYDANGEDVTSYYSNIQKVDGLLVVDTAENKAFNGNGSVAAVSKSIATVLGGTGYVDVKLTDAKTGTAGTNQFVTYVFGVIPYDANYVVQHNLAADITFRLPLYNPDNYAYADVYHENVFLKQVALKNTDTYIEVTARNYSEYSYTLTNTARSSGNVIGGGSISSTYNVNVADATNGTVTASAKNASAGGTVTLMVKPDEGWTLETITVLDKSGKEVALTAKTVGATYTFQMPSSAVSVKATFMEDNTMLNFFVDVAATDYFYDAVLWATENGITSGIDTTHFNPSGITTRGQMVTFLWRAAGSPEPTTTSCKFTDIAADAYYYKAVLWAVEKGITSGTGDTTFSPNATVTRGQVVAFLWRYEGSKTAEDANVFTDVASGNYYYNAVLWAKAQGITSGTSATTFSPNASCTRGQVVTFLYKDIAK